MLPVLSGAELQPPGSWHITSVRQTACVVVLASTGDTKTGSQRRIPKDNTSCRPLSAYLPTCSPSSSFTSVQLRGSLIYTLVSALFRRQRKQSSSSLHYYLVHESCKPDSSRLLLPPPPPRCLAVNSLFYWFAVSLVRSLSPSTTGCCQCTVVVVVAVGSGDGKGRRCCPRQLLFVEGLLVLLEHLLPSKFSPIGVNHRLVWCFPAATVGTGRRSVF